MILRNHYETLGINKGATDEDVRRAYHRLARLYHPDKNDDPKTEEKFKEIGQAYEIMKNKDSRQIWEREFARQTQNFRDQRSHSAKQSPKKEAKSSSSTSKSSPTKENTKPDPKTSGKYKYKFFFTDSDYENENEENEKMRKRQSKRSQSYAGTEKSRFRETDFTFQFPDPDDDFKSREKNKNKWNNNFADNNNTNRGSSFGFNIYMDSDNGFQSFSDPFHMFYEWQDKTFQHRDFDEDDAEEFLANFKEECKEKKNKAKECAGNEGESDWYDWTRVFQPYDSEDDENENDRLTCTWCRKQMTPELLRKHEPRCRRFAGGPDILAYRHKQAQLHSTQDRRRRTSLQQDAKANVSKDELITCMYCYRKFNQKVADRHIEFCERQTHQTGRPMNPLGKSAAARDYSSKNFTAKEYAKTVPKPGTKPPSSKRRQSPHSSDPERGDSAHTNNNNDINNGSQTTSSPDVNKNKPFRRRTSKPKLIDINILPPNTKFSTTSSAADSFPGEGCATCQRNYGTSVSRFTCSCGVRKSFSSTTANT